MVIDIPKASDLDDFFVLFYRLKTKKAFVGPNLILFVKLTGEKESLKEKSSFDLPEENKSEPQLLEAASNLMDEGFGTFERCLLASKMLNGDLTKARDVLSNLMITEASQ